GTSLKRGVNEMRYGVANAKHAWQPRSHSVPDGPKIVENWFKQRLFQKRHARRSASAVFRADCSLNQFDVTIAPFLQALVEIGHQFEKDRNLRRTLVEP